MMYDQLKTWWQNVQNQRFRRQLQRSFVADDAPQTYVSSQADGQLWQRIESSLDLIFKGQQRRDQKIVRTGMLLSGGLLALIALVLIWPKSPTPSDWTGIKAVDNQVDFTPLDDFKVAAVNTTQQITPLSDKSVVHRGQTLIFSSRSKPAPDGLPLAEKAALWHFRIPEVPSPLIENYPLSIEQTVFKGTHGYYAYTITDPGVHVFFVEATDKTSENSNDATTKSVGKEISHGLEISILVNE